MSRIRVTAVDPDAVRELTDLADRADGFPSLGESVWHDVAAPGPRSFDVVAEVRGVLVALAHVMATDDRVSAHHELGLVVAPQARDVGLVTDVLAAGLEQVGDGEELLAWFPGAPAYATKAAEAVGFSSQRELFRMECALPLGVAADWPEGVEVRTFEPGVDEAAWLAVNNRAFAGHPEQGAWTEAMLRRRVEEPWFDPRGFVLAFSDGDLAGFCWTKRHEAGLGEIFVIGVDPAYQERGLGRALVLEGLRSLHARGCGTGMLYVDAADTTAVGLYRSLGFEIVRTDAAYVREGS